MIDKRSRRRLIINGERRKSVVVVIVVIGFAVAAIVRLSAGRRPEIVPERV